ncbi:MAG TPA: FAD-dependent oxidoreductase [Solirubrobacteraceae bacterium]|nr:FAD-dependent oxidoreductase [Solirubrobacteraceae bacterium]
MSERRRLLVVGGVAAGMSAAARAKRLEPELDVVVFERSGFCSYTACGLPYHVGGVIADHRALVMRTPAQFAEDGVAVHVRHEVTEIDPGARRLRVRALDGGRERSEPWDALVLAAGARPAGTAMPGARLPGVFTLRTIEDAQAIRAWIDAAGVRDAVVIGGGYIGLEMAEALRRRGLATTVVEREDHVLPLVDADIAGDIAGELEAQGVELRCATAVEEIAGDERVRAVVAGGQAIAADVVVIGVGVRPDTAIAAAAGVPLGPHGGIIVDAAMRTGVDGIWAAGDCCQTRHLLHDRPAYVPLGTTANKQGRVAAAGVTGGDEAFAGVLGTAVVKVCDLHVGRTGLSERDARDAGLDAVSASVTHLSRARYYPGHRPLRVKLVAERASGRLLGGQLVGREGVAKRVDVVAAALHSGATADELAQYDLSYAPPFAPVWDPVLLAARKAAERSARAAPLPEAVS